MIVVRKDLIATGNRIYIPDNTMSITDTDTNIKNLILGSRNINILDDLQSLIRRIHAELVHAKDPKEAIKNFEYHYNTVSGFRRKYRHITVVEVNANNILTIYDVDNMYLDRKVVHSTEVVWKHGVESFDISSLEQWDVMTPRGWKALTWANVG